ncbi:MAG TPA: exopolysaccharide biosynthesis protein [Stenotrophomonas sp.]|nr:exopolysaccharide biosynthesis protein [Stenotrophomonas sp.]
MTPSDDASAASGPAPYRNEGIRTLLSTFQHGDPAELLSLRHILGDLQQSAFGVFLFVAILPAFIPIPGLGGAVSGPLTVLIGVQMVLGLRRPWLPAFIGRRGPRRGTGQRFVGKIAPLLRWLDRLLKPRLAWLLDSLPAQAFTGLMLIVTGLLLSLPIPFTNYLFGVILLFFALALLERDGGLLLLCWVATIGSIVVLGVTSDQLVELLQHWWAKLT